MSTAKIAKPPKIIRKSSHTARSRPYCAVFLVLREKVYDIVIASGASHQADNLAKLRHEHLSVLELIAQILGAVSSEISLMWLSAVRGTRIAVATMTTFSRKTVLL